MLETLIVRLDAQVAAFERALSEADRRVAAFGSKMQSVGGTLTLGLTAPLTAAGVGAVAAAVKMESLERGLAAVTGSADATAKQMERLEAVARLPGLGFAEAVQGATRLQAAGLSAELAEKALRGFGNALATVGAGREELQGVIMALTQIQAKGKVSAEEINQIAERLPQIRKVMEQAFGTSNTEALQGMELSAAQFVEGVVTELNKLPPVVAGAGNSFENLKDALFRAGAAFGEVILPVLVPLANGFAAMLEQVNSLEPATRVLILTFGALAAAIGPVLVAAGTLVKLLPLLKVGFAALGGPVTLAAVAAFTALTAAGVALIENWSVIKYEVGLLVEKIREHLVGRFETIVESVRQKVEAIKGFFKGMYEAVVGGSYVPDMIDGIAAHFARLDGVMVGPTQRSTSKIIDAFSNMTAEVAESGGVLENVLGAARSRLESFASSAVSSKLPGVNIFNPMSIFTSAADMIIGGALDAIFGRGDFDKAGRRARELANKTAGAMYGSGSMGGIGASMRNVPLHFNPAAAAYRVGATPQHTQPTTPINVGSVTINANSWQDFRRQWDDAIRAGDPVARALAAAAR